jgi:ABC-type nitrate/sulfonate/bicarbonate transport system substrate-binding protein
MVYSLTSAKASRLDLSFMSGYPSRQAGFLQQDAVVLTLILGLFLWHSGMVWAQIPERVFITATNLEDLMSAHIRYGIEQGIFKREGVDLQFRAMPPSLTFPAMAAGEVDYTSQVGSAFRAIMRGFPAKVLAVGLNRPLFFIVAQPHVSSPRDLVGKKFAVSSLSGAGARSARIALGKLGLNPEKDVTFIVIGNVNTRVAALEAGSIEATVLQPPFNIHMRRRGFKQIIFSGALVTDFLAGVITTRDKLEKNPAQVKALVKGFLQSLTALRGNRKGAVEFLSTRYRLDLEAASELYDMLMQVLTVDGIVSPQELRDYLDLVKEETRFKTPLAADDLVLK